MKKGGYKIIDFKGTALSGTAVELPDAYDQIIDDYDKAILVSGVSLNGELQDDAFASVKVNDGSVELTAYGGIITVTEDDEVTFVVSKTTAELIAEINEVNEKVNDLITTTIIQSNVIETMEVGSTGNFTGNLSSELSEDYEIIGVVGYIVTSSGMIVIESTIIQSATAFRMLILNNSSSTINNARVTVRVLLKHK